MRVFLAVAAVASMAACTTTPVYDPAYGGFGKDSDRVESVTESGGKREFYCKAHPDDVNRVLVVQTIGSSSGQRATDAFAFMSPMKAPDPDFIYEAGLREWLKVKQRDCTVARVSVVPPPIYGREFWLACATAAP